MPHSPDIPIPTRMRPGIVAVLVATVCIAIAATYFSAQRLFESQAISVAQSQHALYLRSLNEAIKQHQHLPFVLGENPAFGTKLARGDAEDLNETLAAFAEASALEAIYVMALNGDVVAASNYRLAQSFLGQNYGFRPYFQGAARGVRSDYFAIGATTGRPGYFVAEPLRAASGDIQGVVAIKLDISELQQSWEERGEAVLAVNGDGIVVLSSNPDWLYQTVRDLDQSTRDRILSSRQFGAEGIAPLPWQSDEAGHVTLANQSYIVTSGTTEVVDWTVHYLTSRTVIARQTWLATGVLGFAIAALIGFSVFLRSRRIQAALAVSQAQSKALSEANARLLQAQEDLARSSKMAALGQLAASVTHELGQPISAFKNHLVAAEIGQEITSQDTLDNLRRLAERMEAITRQLRFFSRKGGEDREAVDPSAVIREALALMRHDLDAAQVKVDWQLPSAATTVWASRLQLEQAMVNLLRNALDAARDSAAPHIWIAQNNTADGIEIAVRDSGPGLRGLTLETLQEPFYSTRSSGDGMGLGLAITSEIVRAHGGSMSAIDSKEGGAQFKLTLPKGEGAT